MPQTIHKSRIGQIISRQVVTVDPDTPLEVAIALMARERISCLVVASRKRPVGIFTERDLVRAAARHEILQGRPISELMTSPVVTIHSKLSLYEAFGIMLSNKIRHHVVVDCNGKIMGVMSQSDLIKILGLEYFVEMRLVEQIMTTGVMTVPLQLCTSEALARMAAGGISCVVVVQGAVPVGILTERDAVRLVTEGVHPDTVPIESLMSKPVLTVPQGTTVHRAALLMKQEKIRHLVVVDDSGAIAGIITQSDIVKGLEGKYIEALKEIIREKEDVFRQTAQELLDKTFYLDNILSTSIDMAIVATDSEFRVKYFNPVAEKVFNRSQADAIGRSALELHDLEGAVGVHLQRALNVVRKRGKHEFALEITRKGLTRFYQGTLSRILDRQKNLVGYVLMLHDVTQRREQERTIHHMAYHDALTGLPNRVLLGDRLTQALTTSKRNNSAGALMILDLDRFKDINDTLGHNTGDALLKQVSSRLTTLLRKSDTVSRMGGDEFVILLPTIADSGSSAVIAAKIVRAFRRPFLCDGHTLKVTTSIGIAHFPDDGDDAGTVLKNADIALYRVKESGRNGYQRFSRAD
jgi:diguanylate cyclase (GGDEF)-like protein/PAS domain S-box-containing protein